jgi:hypothetical protein
LDQDMMEAMGRSAAQEFLQPQCMAEWTSPDGTEHYAMRPNLRQWNVAQELWEKTAIPRTTESTAAQHMANLITAKTAQTMDKALRNLGAGRVVGASMENLRVSVTRYVVAIIGPAASKFWEQPPRPGQVHPHGAALCGFCLEAALHCTCEHIYAGLIKRGTLDIAGTGPSQRNRKRKGAPPPSDASPGILLATLTPQFDRARASTPSLVPADKLLAKVLKAVGAADAIDTFTTEGFSMESLAAW